MTIEQFGKFDLDEFLGTRNYYHYYYDVDGTKSKVHDISDKATHHDVVKNHNEAFAIQIEITDGPHSTVVYYCPVYRGKLLDPVGIDASKKSKAEFRHVSEEVFNFYKEFLVTKNQTSLVRAERSRVDV